MKTLMFTRSESDLKQAAQLLAADEVVALPTETVYGLAGNAFSETAVKKIFAAKERPANDPLIVHVAQSIFSDDPVNALENAGIINLKAWSSDLRTKVSLLIKTFWPGPLTIVLPKGNQIPDIVTSSQDTVGVRCPHHPVFQGILNQLPFPLAAPSANRFGRISPTQAKHVEDELDGRISAIVDGGSCNVGLESTIIKMESPFKVTLLRPGKVAIAEIEILLKHKASIIQVNEKEVTPGSLDDHYAPRKPLYLLTAPFHLVKNPLSILPSDLPVESIGYLKMSDLGPNLSLEDAAAQLYHKMRLLDHDPAIEVIVADVPAEKDGLGAAIRDRLKRASRNKPKV